jgi:hypothetical protein
VKGYKIKVKGIVKETFSFGIKTAIVLVEASEKVSKLKIRSGFASFDYSLFTIRAVFCINIA